MCLHRSGSLSLCLCLHLTPAPPPILSHHLSLTWFLMKTVRPHLNVAAVHTAVFLGQEASYVTVIPSPPAPHVLGYTGPSLSHTAHPCTSCTLRVGLGCCGCKLAPTFSLSVLISFLSSLFRSFPGASAVGREEWKMSSFPGQFAACKSHGKASLREQKVN